MLPSLRRCSSYKDTIRNLAVDGNSRVIVQGFTGKASTFHSQIAIDVGTNIVGGTSPNKGGTSHLGLPVYSSVKEAVRYLKPHVTSVFVPPALAADAIIDAVENEVPLIVSVAEGVPTHDQLRIQSVLQTQSKSRLVGPNCPGMINPAGCKLGIQPAAIHSPGVIGIAARSGTLSYETADSTTKSGLGQSYVFGLGGDPFPGTRTVEALEFLLSDDRTKGIALIGEIGGTMEEEVAEYLQGKSVSKPIVGFITGLTAPEYRSLGHAGAIWRYGKHGAESKIQSWKDVGIRMVDTTAEIGPVLKDLL